MKKILSTLVVVFLFASLLVPVAFVEAQTTVEIYNAGTTYSSNIQLQTLHPSETSDVSAVGGVIVPTTAGYLTQVNVKLYENTGATGLLYCAVAPITGDPNGTSAIPNGTTMSDVSTNSINIASIAATATWYTFTFDTGYLMSPGTGYAIYVFSPNFAGNYMLCYHSSTKYTNNTLFSYHNLAWDNTEGAYSFAVQVYGLDEDPYPDSTPTPPPVTTPTPDPGDGGDADMEALTDAILPFLVPLLICLIPALLGYKFVGELGFFIGLNVGVILAYVTLAGTAYAFPLWGIILVGVMDVAVVLMRR